MKCEGSKRDVQARGMLDLLGGLAGHTSGICLHHHTNMMLPSKERANLDIIIIITIITRFQSEDQVCISTTLRDLDKSVLTHTCRCESQSRLSN